MINGEVFELNDHRYTVIPSGFRDIRIVIHEDPAYNLDVCYVTEKKYKEIKQTVEDKNAPKMQCLTCGWEGPLSGCPPLTEEGEPCCPVCEALVLEIVMKPIDRGDTGVVCPICLWEGPLKECNTIAGSVGYCPVCSALTYVMSEKPDVA